MALLVKQGAGHTPPVSGARWPAFVLAVVGISSFMITLDVTALNVALPSIGREFSVPVAALQWVANAYTLVFSGLLLTAGASSDRWGARRVFHGALAFFTLASIACTLADTISTLIIARAIQGLGAAAILPSSMALLTHAYPQATLRTRALAIWSGISATALVAGPLIGGALVEAYGWRSIFFINLPVCLVALAIAYVSAGRPATRRRAFDPLGQTLAIVALLALTYTVIEVRSLGWHSPLIWGTFSGGITATILFIAVERYQRDPMLPLSLFASSTFSASVCAAFLYNLSYYGAMFVLPLALQAQGKSPLAVGVILIPITLSTALLATASGWIVSYIGPRLLAALGMLAGAIGAAALAVFGFAQWSTIIGGVLIGMGGATLPLIVGAALANLPSERVGIGAGVLNAARQSGGAMGIAVMGALLYGKTLQADISLATISSVFFAAAVLVFFRLR